LTADSAGALTDAFASQTNRYGIGPNLTWQLNQNAARARVAEAQADVRIRLARFDGVVLTAVRETESALTSYTHNLDRNTDLTAVRSQARTAAAQAQAL
jgi:outer membrane protein, multidrug efflux system